MPRATKGLLTPLMNKIVANYTGDLKKACELAGASKTYHNGAFQRFPQLKTACYKKEAEMIKESAKLQVRSDTMGRDYILKRLRQIADEGPDARGGFTSQVQALKLGAEIQGHIIERSADLTKEFDGKSEQDMEFFSKNGYWPNVDAGQSRPN